MSFLKRFIKLMKSELFKKKEKKKSFGWVIDESKCLNINEVKKLRCVCNRDKNIGLGKRKFSPLRNWFMLELGLEAGLRVQEMATLRCSSLLIDTKRSSIVLIGKGNKKRAVWINSKFKKTCELFLKYKKDFGYSANAEDFLLNNLKGEGITKRALQKFFGNIVRKANVPRHYSIHCLRHTYATFLLDASNNNYRFVQKQLGHSSIRTTQTYAGVIDSKGRKALEKLYE